MRPNTWPSPVQVEGMTLYIDDLVGSTGLELKVDPGVPYVYAGFAGIAAGVTLNIVTVLNSSHQLTARVLSFLHVKWQMSYTCICCDRHAVLHHDH